MLWSKHYNSSLLNHGFTALFITADFRAWCESLNCPVHFLPSSLAFAYYSSLLSKFSRSACSESILFSNIELYWIPFIYICLGSKNAPECVNLGYFKTEPMKVQHNLGFSLKIIRFNRHFLLVYTYPSLLPLWLGLSSVFPAAEVQSLGILNLPKECVYLIFPELLSLTAAGGCFSWNPHPHYETTFKVKRKKFSEIHLNSSRGQTSALSTSEHTRALEPAPQCTLMWEGKM